MKKNKVLIIFSLVLIILLILIVGLLINLHYKQSFRPPKFDSNASNKIPTNVDYQSELLNVGEGYSIYISAKPKLIKNNLKVDFISLDRNNIWIKIRVLHNDEIIGESGLVKPGQYLEKIKLNKKVSAKDNITYMIMGYEPETYLSAGTITLNTRVDE